MKNNGPSPAVQWLRCHASTAGGVGSIPGQGARIPHAVWHGQNNNNNNMSHIFNKFIYMYTHSL